MAQKNLMIFDYTRFNKILMYRIMVSAGILISDSIRVLSAFRYKL
jgi:hypothetical protein